ncbi:Arc family DNA-binding protein [Undibacterium sp.]|uniref:Arc family DNA-binding protein n=1 Tax=Undibacterium sp. TaxID=1914977 RepID=UPI003751781F
MSIEAKIQLRLPIDIKNWLSVHSKENFRSMNGQMIEILRNVKLKESQNAKQ